MKPEPTDQDIRKELERRGQLRLPGCDLEHYDMHLYQPGARWGIDRIENGRGVYGGRSLDDLMSANPGAILVTQDDMHERIRDVTRTAPKRIDAERWREMLNVLPPEHWVRRPDAESFNLCERENLDMALILVRVGERYWEFTDRISMTHDERVKRALESEK